MDDEDEIVVTTLPEVVAHVIRCLGCRRPYLDILSACPYCKMPKA